MILTNFLHKSAVRYNDEKDSFKETHYFRVAKVGCAIALGLGSCISLSLPALSQSDDLTEEQLFRLCSKYPTNSRCENYEVPVALSQRQGDTGICALNTNSLSVTDKCKIDVADSQITVYIEQGNTTRLLDNERRTQTFTFDLAAIDSLAYREDESINQGRLIANTLLLGVWGTLLTRPDKVSQVEIQFAEPANADATINTSSERVELFPEQAVEQPVEQATLPVDSASATSSSLVFEADRKEGKQLRESIEQITGLTARVGL